MTTNKRQRFEQAYRAWKAEQVELADASSALWDFSQSGVSNQSMVSDMLDAYYERGHILPTPVPVQRWHDAATSLIARNIRSLRRQQQTGRQQLAGREQLRRTERLQEVWAAYRAATGR